MNIPLFFNFFFFLCTCSREIIYIFHHLKTTHFCCLLLRHCESESFQTLHDYNLAQGLHFHFTFYDLDSASRSQVVININCKLCCLDSCPLQFKCYMVATYIKKIMHNANCGM